MEILFGAEIAIGARAAVRDLLREGTKGQVKNTAKPVKKAKKLGSAKKLEQTSPLRMAR
jgi:hypothetical protein